MRRLVNDTYHGFLLRILYMRLSTVIHRNFVLGFSSRIALASLLVVTANTSLAQDGWVNGRTPDG